jgi:predicted nuclease with TOPRIM domain
MQENAQVFIKIEDYKKIISTVNLLKTKLEEAKEILKSISELKIQEYNQLSKWDSNLEEIEKRIKSVDQELGRL